MVGRGCWAEKWVNEGTWTSAAASGRARSARRADWSSALALAGLFVWASRVKRRSTFAQRVRELIGDY